VTRRRYILCSTLAVLFAVLFIAHLIAWGFSYRYAAAYGWAQLKQDANSSEVRTVRASAGRGTLTFSTEHYRRIVATEIATQHAELPYPLLAELVARDNFKVMQNLDAGRVQDTNSGWLFRRMPKLRRPIQSQRPPVYRRGQIPGSYSINLSIPMWAISLFPVSVCLLFWRLRGNRHKAGYCRQCGYSLAGNRSGACPECGAACKAADPAGVSPAAGD